MERTSAAALARVLAGERRAVAQAITALENEAPGAQDLARALAGHAGHAHVIGITGAPGAGKSTLINAILGELLRRELRIAVVAVDPSSPLTGGAVLGDRVRMGEHGAHERVFIRSVSSRGHLGGLSRTTGRVVDVFDAAGYDVVLVETVGAGQSEVEITALADTRIVVCPPGLGDEVQALKAGILEIADVFVVSKGDLPAAEATVRDLRDMLRLRARGAPSIPVLKTVATRGEGVRELVDFALAHGVDGAHGRRRLAPRAPSSDEIAVVDRLLAPRATPTSFARTPVERACVEAILASAGDPPEAARWHVRVSAENRAAASDAPTTLLCVGPAPDARHAVGCGMWVQRVVTAARARGLDARVEAGDDAASTSSHSCASGSSGPVALAIRLGYPSATTPPVTASPVSAELR